MIRGHEPERLVKFDATTYKQLVGQRLLIGTAIVVLAAFVSQILGPDKAKGWAMKILEMWLYFLGFAVMGVNMGQYGLQRFSAKEYVREKTAGQGGNGNTGSYAIANGASAQADKMRASQAQPAEKEGGD